MRRVRARERRANLVWPGRRTELRKVDDSLDHVLATHRPGQSKRNDEL